MEERERGTRKRQSCLRAWARRIVQTHTLRELSRFKYRRLNARVYLLHRQCASLSMRMFPLVGQLFVAPLRPLALGVFRALSAHSFPFLHPISFATHQFSVAVDCTATALERWSAACQPCHSTCARLSQSHRSVLSRELLLRSPCHPFAIRHEHQSKQTMALDAHRLQFDRSRTLPATHITPIQMPAAHSASPMSTGRCDVFSPRLPQTLPAHRTSPFRALRHHSIFVFGSVLHHVALRLCSLPIFCWRRSCAPSTCVSGSCYVDVSFEGLQCPFCRVLLPTKLTQVLLLTHDEGHVVRIEGGYESSAELDRCVRASPLLLIWVRAVGARQGSTALDARSHSIHPT
eukprot:4200862-Pleurochrysis_carterae.AAC.2